MTGLPRSNCRISWIAVLLLLSAGCRPHAVTTVPEQNSPAAYQQVGNQPSGALRFSEVAELSGVSFTYRNGEESGYFAILESLGGGVALCDFDRDGRDDVCLPGGGQLTADQQLPGLPNGLFRNLGDWKFTDVSAATHVHESRYYTHAVCAGDYDSDGFPDLLFTGYGGLQLFRNLGDGTFEELAEAAELLDRSWSSSAAWGDLNGDGLLDLFVAHYVNWSFENNPLCPGTPPHPQEICPPRQFQGLPDVLYLNRGDGTFEDASTAWGLLPPSKGLGVVLADLDGDGDLDIYVTNDTVPNHLYENVNRTGLKDRSLISGTSLSDRGVPDGSMGVEVFDFNQDGLPDLWVVNYENESAALYQNDGRLMFRHVSQAAGVTAVGGMFVGWGTSCQDFDLDGDQDMFVANGHVIRFPINVPPRQSPLLFENLGRNRFRNAAPEAGDYLRSQHMARGAAAGDLDDDGDVDLVVVHTNDPVALLRNDAPAGSHWLKVRLIGTSSSRDAIGARVEVLSGGQRQVRQWTGGGSYASTHSAVLHFGLAGNSQVETLRVVWPSGLTEEYSDLPVNRLVRLVEGAGQPW